MSSTPEHSRRFIAFALECGALRFGSFRLKSGRHSPYFFNAGRFDTGGRLERLAGFYSDALMASGVEFDMLFGPAYKGIPLATALAMVCRRRLERDIPFAFNRKERKGHGEGGLTFGAPIAGRVLIVDDVVSAGLSVREAASLIRDAGATVAGVVVALDREERGVDGGRASAELAALLQAPVVSVARLGDLVAWLAEQPEQAAHLERIRAYQQQFGAAA